MTFQTKRWVLCATLALAGCSRGAATEATQSRGKRLAEVLAAQPRKPEFDATLADLTAQAEGATRGYQPDGAPIDFTLDAPAFALPVKAGHCYRAVVRLGADAVFSDLAERGLRFDVLMPGKSVRPSGSAVGPGAIFDLHCASVDGQALVKMSSPAAAELVASSPRSMGSGAATVQLYGRAAEATDWGGAELKELLTKELAGLSAVDAPIEGALELPASASFSLSSGWCYKIAVVLRPGAAFGTGKVGLAVGEATTRGPGTVTDLGCVTGNRLQPLKLRSGRGGHGAFVAQLYGRRGVEAPVAVTAAVAAGGRAAVCRQCSDERTQCLAHDSVGTCEGSWNTCVRAHSGVSESPYSYCR